MAKQNLRHNIDIGNLANSASSDIQFLKGDVLDASSRPKFEGRFDVLVSNPPYISPHAFAKTTARSVRNHEPLTALVPPPASYQEDLPIDQGDIFYPRLLQIAERFQAQVILFEVADMDQAKRVSSLVLKHARWQVCEIWRDWPVQGSEADDCKLVIEDKKVPVKGEGEGRAVFAWTCNGHKILM